MDKNTESDIFLFPSYHEGCPNAVLEAMAAGLPVVSTRAGCLNDIIENYINGIFIKERSVEEIVDAVNILINNRMLREKIGCNNREKARREFDVRVIFKRIEQIYSHLLSDICL